MEYMHCNVPTTDLNLNKTVFQSRCLHELNTRYLVHDMKTPVGGNNDIKVYSCLQYVTEVRTPYKASFDYCSLRM